ncbi:hypothetical protein ES703_57620 [subsurface metagenome]
MTIKKKEIKKILSSIIIGTGIFFTIFSIKDWLMNKISPLGLFIAGIVIIILGLWWFDI